MHYIKPVCTLIWFRQLRHENVQFPPVAFACTMDLALNLLSLTLITKSGLITIITGT